MQRLFESFWAFTFDFLYMLAKARGHLRGHSQKKKIENAFSEEWIQLIMLNSSECKYFHLLFVLT